MDVATSQTSVGVRDLKNNLSRYLALVKNGVEVTVTDRGRPIARLGGIDAATDRLADLIEAGLVEAPRDPARPRPVRRVEARGSVSDLVADQRR